MISKTKQVFLNVLRGDTPSNLEGVDLDELFNLFHRHRLFNLAPVIKELLDTEEWQRWKQAIQSRTMKSLHQTSVLAQLISAFQNKGIEALPLKGPVLAQSLYGSIGERHYTDLDVLIRSAEMERAIEVAESLGYELEYPDRMMSPKKWAYYFKYKKDAGLVHRKDNIFIELHAGIASHWLLKQEGENMLWEDMVVDQLGNTTLKRMNDNVTFLYLAFHGGLHQYFRLFWLRDISAALQNWDLDHQQIFSTARSLGIKRYILVSVLLARDYFNSEIPVIYREEILSDHRRIQRIKSLFVRRIEGPENPSLMDRFNRNRLFLLVKPGFGYCWVVFWSIVNRWYIKKFLGGR